MNKLKDIRGMTKEETLQWYESLSEEEKEELQANIKEVYDTVVVPFMQAVAIWYEERFQPVLEQWYDMIYGEHDV